MSQPFFSIGIPTYNRHDFLREAITSILSQNFADFEVIVGNDYTAESLTGEMIGITDPRVRFVNHPQNLREVGNMNRLLELAEGRYFTWLFDDDLFDPAFLKTAYDTLTECNCPSAFFSSFNVLQAGMPPQASTPRASGQTELLTGREFLNRYDPIRPDLISTSGIFNIQELRAVVGGVEEVCFSSIGLYCEYLFLVRCGLLKSIAYTPLPLVTFRIHSESWGEVNTELDKYREGGVNLLRKCADVLQDSSLREDRQQNLMKICSIHLYSFATKSTMYEVVRNQYGVAAAWRAITGFFRESRNIRKAYAVAVNCGIFSVRQAFLSIESYCCRLILFKLRHFRSQRR